MTLYFITGNKNKLKEVQEILGGNIEQLDMDLPEIQELDAKKIIEEKINIAMKIHKGNFIVEDTSLYFNGLNGMPGPFIKWFLQALGSDGLYKLAKSSGNMDARASTLIGYYDGTKTIFFEGVTEGKIVKPVGETNFGWDPIFVPKGFNKTYAQMTAAEKNSISHRRKALDKLKKALI